MIPAAALLEAAEPPKKRVACREPDCPNDAPARGRYAGRCDDHRPHPDSLAGTKVICRSPGCLNQAPKLGRYAGRCEQHRNFVSSEKKVVAKRGGYEPTAEGPPPEEPPSRGRRSKHELERTIALTELDHVREQIEQEKSLLAFASLNRAMGSCLRAFESYVRESRGG